MLMKLESNSVVYLTWHTPMFWNALFFLCGVQFFHHLRSKCSAEPKWLKSFCHLHAHPEMKFRKWSLENEATAESRLWGKSFAEGSPLWLCTWGKCTCGDPVEGFRFSRGRLDKVSQSTDWVQEKKTRVEPTHGADASLFTGDESWPLWTLVMGLFPLVLCASNQKGRLLSARS